MLSLSLSPLELLKVFFWQIHMTDPNRGLIHGWCYKNHLEGDVLEATELDSRVSFFQKADICFK